MRPIAMLAAVTGALALASACSDDGGTTPTGNTAPVADFALPPCSIDVPCNFTSTSTDDAAVTEWSWDFDGDGASDADTETAVFTYTAAGNFDVSLAVSDAQGLTHSRTRAITIAPVDPTNTRPTASFTHTCEATTCSFTSTSTDVAPGTVAGHAWDFGDGATADVADPSHTYTVAVPTDFTVTLTVTDDQGASDVVTQTVSVAPGAQPNTPPTAGFTHTCQAATCSFTSTSTDVAPGSIVGHAWTFGDGATAEVNNPSHTYSVTAPAEFTVTLTVTDDQGATGVATQMVSVSPPPPVAEGCTTWGTRVDCALDVTSRSTIKLKLLAVSCDLSKQRITVPQGDQVFLNVCSRTAGDSTKIFGGPLDEAWIFEPGSQVRLRFNQGTPDEGAPALPPPAARVTGTFPNWTISFEDGDNAGGEGEPDFADVVLGVEAVPAR
ncbi:MAG TPA: PKD domain-containing protein [Gemmatimonadales bacterium]|nr:PKD domain-containing protein [Gemmatimonadales bacterium]